MEGCGRVGRLNKQYRRVVWDLVRAAVSGTIRNLAGRQGVSESRSWLGLETTNSLSAVLEVDLGVKLVKEVRKRSLSSLSRRTRCCQAK